MVSNYHSSSPNSERTRNTHRMTQQSDFRIPPGNPCDTFGSFQVTFCVSERKRWFEAGKSILDSWDCLKSIGNSFWSIKPYLGSSITLKPSIWSPDPSQVRPGLIISNNPRTQWGFVVPPEFRFSLVETKLILILIDRDRYCSSEKAKRPGTPVHATEICLGECV